MYQRTLYPLRTGDRHASRRWEQLRSRFDGCVRTEDRQLAWRQKMDQIGEGSSGPGPGLPSGADDGEATRTFSGRDPVIQPRLADPAKPWWLGPLADTAPSQPPTYIPPT